MGSWEKLRRDYLLFGRVSPSSWGFSATKINHTFNRSSFSSAKIPCILLLDTNKDEQQIYSLSLRRTIAKVSLPGESSDSPSSVSFVECSIPVAESFTCGWILRCSDHDNRQPLRLTLINPFSGAEFLLPDFCHSYRSAAVTKVALSKNPGNVYGFEITVIANGFLAYWKVGDKDWTLVKNPRKIMHDHYEYGEIKYHNGKLYAVNEKGRVEVFSTNYQTSVVFLPDWCNLDNSYVDFFLVEKSTETLFLVWKILGDPVVYVCEVDAIKGGCKEVRDLGDKSIFLGKSYSSLVDAAQKKIEPNKIFCSRKDFSFDSTTIYAYDLEDKTWVKCFSCGSHYQPIFINPTIR